MTKNIYFKRLNAEITGDRNSEIQFEVMIWQRAQTSNNECENMGLHKKELLNASIVPVLLHNNTKTSGSKIFKKS